MEIKYEIREGNVVEVVTKFNLQDFIKGLESDKDSYGRDTNLKASILNSIAEEVAKQFILKHLSDVLKLIDPKEVANLTILQASEKLNRIT